MRSLAIGATYGCGADDGEATEPGGTDGTASEGGRPESSDAKAGVYSREAPDGAQGNRAYRGPIHKNWGSGDWSCDAVEGDSYPIVFVSPKGADDSPGTPKGPVLTLARALRLATERGHSVYVCP